MQSLIRLFYLIACLVVMSSVAMAQEQLPDLTAVVNNANQGLLEVRNMGEAVAKPSQVFVNCSIFDSTSPNKPCAVDLHLANYIVKWNVLSYDIPALQPGGQYQIHLFGSGALPRRPGNYGMAITIDPLKQITESNELNNSTRLDTIIEASPGTLRVVVQDDKHNALAPFSYFMQKHGDKEEYKSIIAYGNNQTSPLDVHVPAGRYDVHIVRESNFYAGLNGLKKYYSNVTDIQRDMNQHILTPKREKIISDIRIKSGNTTKIQVVLKHIEAGFLRLYVDTDSKYKPQKMWLKITPSAQRDSLLVLHNPFHFDTALKVPLAPGSYRIYIEPQSSGYQGAGYQKKEFSVIIKPGETRAKTVTFTRRKKGMLKLTVLVNGSRSKAKISIRKAAKKGNFLSVRTIFNMVTNKVDLLPGLYDISVVPLEYALSLGGVDVFHGGVEGPSLKTKRIPNIKPIILHNIEIKSGEPLEKIVKFEKHK